MNDSIEKKRIVAIVPARYGSTRFVGKPLADIEGQTMIERVWRQVIQARLPELVLVATDDQRIYDHVIEFGGQAMMTSVNHRNGTERIAEVVTQLLGCEYVINIQGDEPFIDPSHIDAALQLVIDGAQIATLAIEKSDQDRFQSPHAVKVVTRDDGRALYFSRSAIPHQAKQFLKHIGIYAFQAELLQKLIHDDVSRLEQVESLEQLRWLSHGYDIQVGLTDIETPSIDTPDDLKRAVLWAKEKGML